MKFFPALGDDPLDADSLPATDKTELNYRTRPLTGTDERRITLLVLLVPVPVLISCTAVLQGILHIHPFFESLFYGLIILLAVCLAWLHLIGSLHRRTSVVSGLLSISFICGRLWQWVDAEWIGALSLLACWLLCTAICKQAAAWILVGPQVDHETMERWKVNLPGIAPRGLSLECPELLTYWLGVLLLGPAWRLSAWAAAELLGFSWLWPFCFLVSLHLFWLLLHLLTLPLVPWPNWWKSWEITARALVIFATYDPFQSRAAGIFRFPTKWLRPPLRRWAVLAIVLVLLAFFVCDACPSLADAVLRGGTYSGQLLLNLALLSFASPLLLVSVLWFTSAAVLARFDEELSKPSSSGTSVWDNYVDRIINSSDELESEHLLLGTTVAYDYPVLVHRDIYDQHGHILGDSGASKTSLGIAPQVTQLIAHADSTVVVVDLKGDRALFEACRLESQRTGRMPFRWICNEVGKTSFAFNPFLQSHNHQLSVEQLSQQILQGLSLDYGLEYGAGFFTAMNEIVLTTVLNNAPVQSFRELDRYLSNRKWYAKHGHVADWNQARHLGALVSRLAANEPVNIVPGMYANQPEVQPQAIDCLQLFEQPQVVYLWLRSSVEPTNAPTIARLFLWAMFTAASHRTAGNRVYFFIDEVQQVISEGIKLIFEQFRDLGGTIIAAHQTTGQLRRYGSDLGDTIDSCTAMKQVYRASDLNSLERLEKLSGSRLTKVSNWIQPYETGTGNLIDRFHPDHAAKGLVNVKQIERPHLDRRQLLEIGAQPMTSLVRFTFGSGYTRFAGGTVPIISQYAITYDEYQRRRGQPWPTAPGAFTVPLAPHRAARAKRRRKQRGESPSDASEERASRAKRQAAKQFLEGFDRRSRK